MRSGPSLRRADPRRAALIRAAVTEASDRIQATARAGSQTHAQALAEARALHSAGKLDEARLLGFVQEGVFDKTAVALSLMCDVPIGLVERALIQSEPEQLLVLAKAIDLSWETTKAILHAVRATQRRHPGMVRPAVCQLFAAAAKDRKDRVAILPTAGTRKSRMAPEVRLLSDPQVPAPSLFLDPVVELPEPHRALGGLHRQLAEIPLRDLQRLLVDRVLAAAGCAGCVSTVGQFRPADRQGIRIRSERGPSISRPIMSSRHVVENRQRDSDLVKFPGFGEIDRRPRRRVRSVRFISFDEFLGHAVVPPRSRRLRPRSSSRTRLISSWIEGGAIASRRARTASLARRSRSRRNLTGRSIRRPRISISSSSSVGAGDDGGIAGFGKMRAGIVRKLADHPAVRRGRR